MLMILSGVGNSHKQLYKTISITKYHVIFLLTSLQERTIVFIWRTAFTKKRKNFMWSLFTHYSGSYRHNHMKHLVYNTWYYCYFVSHLVLFLYWYIESNQRSCQISKLTVTQVNMPLVRKVVKRVLFSSLTDFITTYALRTIAAWTL